MRPQAYITGVAESPLGKVTDHSELSMAGIATKQALEEAGLKLSDVDGIFTNYMGEEGTIQVGEYLDIHPRYADSTDIGGATFVAFLRHASLAIATGACDVALIVYASRQRSRRSRTHGFGEIGTLVTQFEDPHGLQQPLGTFALAATRHMYQYGTTSEQLAEVAVAARSWAALNPNAWSRDPLTIDDVLASPLIVDPLHRLDICLVTDGGGAVVVTGPDRARDATVTPIAILGGAEHHTHIQAAAMPDLTVSSGAVTGQAALAEAGVSPGDIDVLQPYDASTIAVLIALEDLGFCPKGEGGSFVEGGRLATGGTFPAMTSGGGLSYCHPGALGILLVIEAVRQLRGEAGPRQVEGARLGLVHGLGGNFGSAATAVLGRD